MQVPPDRNLVGVQEIADYLGISRQRADQLTRTAGFPEPVRCVIPIDDATRDEILALAATGVLDGALAPEKRYEYYAALGFNLPDYPRLWRNADVERWAVETGRRDNRDN